MVVKANLKHIRSLHRSKGRATHNQYIIEGRRLFQEALFGLCIKNGFNHTEIYRY